MPGALFASRRDRFRKQWLREWRIGTGARRSRDEVEQARLRSGIGIHTKSVVVLPGDMQMCGLTHHASGSVRLALITRGFVGGGIPLHGQLGGLDFIWNVPALSRIGPLTVARAMSVCPPLTFCGPRCSVPPV